MTETAELLVRAVDGATPTGKRSHAKIIKRVIQSLLVAGMLLVATGVGTFLYLGRAETIPAQAEIPDYSDYRLDAKVGWYDLEPGQPVLVTWGADGGLRIVSFGDQRFSERLMPVSESSFRWLSVGGDIERPVEFTANAEGLAMSFHWNDADGESHESRRLAHPPYTVRELQYVNDDVALSGSLFVPVEPGPHPAAVMIHGSGHSDRDNSWYMQIVHHLAGHGIAVLLPDKRGCGKSEGVWQTSSFRDYANDTIAAVNAVQSQEEIDSRRVGIIGISQGGWIAPLAGNISQDIAFVVNLSGAAVTPSVQLRHEVRQDFKNSGCPGFLYELIEPAAVAVPKRRRAQWWELNGEFDPLPYWRDLNVPALICLGRDDESDNVPVEESVLLIEGVQFQKTNAKLDLKVYEGSGHGLFEPGGGRTIRKDFLDLLARWIPENS